MTEIYLIIVQKIAMIFKVVCWLAKRSAVPIAVLTS